MKNFLLKVRDKILFLWFPDFFFFLTPKPKIKDKTLAILKLDAIGDYVLFRNFLETFRRSQKFKDWHITFFGNSVYKDLAEYLDKDFVDEFVWIEKSKLRKDIPYTLGIFKKVWRSGFSVFIHPSYGREVIPDFLVRLSDSPERIGSESSMEILNMQPHQKSITDSFYTALINTGEGTVFEFLRNKKFFEEVAGPETLNQKFFIDADKIKIDLPLPSLFAVLFPGASHENRRWKTENFARVADYLSQKYRLDILICGSVNDSRFFGEIQKNAKVPLKNMTGLSLLHLVKILSLAQVIITNDTAAAHIGAAVKGRVISLLNGRHFGRFSPYPKDLCPNFYPLYSPKLNAEDVSNRSFLEKKYRNKTDASINDISPRDVIKKIEIILG